MARIILCFVTNPSSPACIGVKGLSDRRNMEDDAIVKLFWDRSEHAIRETEVKYGRYLRAAAANILQNEEDISECVNDALLSAWNAIPPARPQMLQTFLGKIVRNLALDRWRRQSAEKRGHGRVAEALDELGELSDSGSFENDLLNGMVLSELLNNFLKGLSETEQLVFMKRYWHFMTTREIAEQTGLTESNVRVILYRCRKDLKKKLQKEGFEL